MKPIKAYVLGGDVATTRMLNDTKHIWARHDVEAPDVNLDDMDMIVFTGGADVHPQYYGELPCDGLWLNPERDIKEFDIFMRTKDTHYHFGICRGMQFLAVANGMKLWQDVTGHNIHGTHDMVPISGKYVGKRIKGVTSVHHQALQVHSDEQKNIIAYENFGQAVTVKDATRETRINRVAEAVWFSETRSFGVQGHPEYSTASEQYIDFTLWHILHDQDTGYFSNK